MKSSWSLGELVFGACLFLGWSSWLSLLMADNFLLFLEVAIFDRGKTISRVLRLIYLIFCSIKLGKKISCLVLSLLFNSINTIGQFSFVISLLLFRLFLGGIHNVLHAKSSYEKGNFFHQYDIKVRMLTLARNKHLFILSFPHRTRPSHMSTENERK